MIEVSLFAAFAEFLDKLPWSILIFLCLTLGLAPFFPPHLFEKIKMLLKDNWFVLSTGLTLLCMQLPGFSWFLNSS